MQTIQRMTAITLALLSTSINAADLMSAWHSAQTRDPELAAARTVLEQAEFRKDQALNKSAALTLADSRASVMAVMR